MALGFVVAKFGLLMRELSRRSPGIAVSTLISEATGVFLALTGAALLVLGAASSRANRKDLEAGRCRTRVGLQWALTVTMIVIGVGLPLYLLSTG